jgi:hypothetical protein
VPTSLRRMVARLVAVCVMIKAFLSWQRGICTAIDLPLAQPSQRVDSTPALIRTLCGQLARAWHTLKYSDTLFCKCNRLANIPLRGAGVVSPWPYCGRQYCGDATAAMRQNVLRRCGRPYCGDGPYCGSIGGRPGHLSPTHQAAELLSHVASPDKTTQTRDR